VINGKGFFFNLYLLVCLFGYVLGGRWRFSSLGLAVVDGHGMGWNLLVEVFSSV
jgi:hypothetical protein